MSKRPNSPPSNSIPSGAIPSGADARTFTTPEQFNELGRGFLPGHTGVEITEVSRDAFKGRMAVREAAMAPNGFLHAASIISLADTLAGYATIASLPDGAEMFTTIELKANFMSTLRDGAIAAIAVPVHRGRTTQVWDVEVTDEASGRRLALFRCTQAVLWPK